MATDHLIKKIMIIKSTSHIIIFFFLLGRGRGPESLFSNFSGTHINCIRLNKKSRPYTPIQTDIMFYIERLHNDRKEAAASIHTHE